MKILQCNRCNRTQKDGKYCLDCGSPLVEVVNESISFKPIKTSRTANTLKKDIRRWLNRIGVHDVDINIAADQDGAEVEYYLQRKGYKFKSVHQDSVTNNLAAVEQFLHHRVIGIERGIENTEQAFKAYEALPSPEDYLANLSDAQIKAEIKRVHPDTGNGDTTRLAALMEEKKRRKLS